jgi:PAS domain S-box-containing protein
MLDLSGQSVTWNVRAQRIKGYQAAEISGRHFSIFYSEADVHAGKCERALAAVLHEGASRTRACRARGRLAFVAHYPPRAYRDLRARS